MLSRSLSSVCQVATMERGSASKVIVIVMVLWIGFYGFMKISSLIPPAVVATEAYASHSDKSATIDHSLFDDLLRSHVRDGFVDYAGLKNQEKLLDEYLESLGSVKQDEHGRDQLLAMYINAYNAATLKLILEHYPGIKSIKNIPDKQRWLAARWKVAGETLSLDSLEHKVLRSRFKEPRIHFAIVCASKGCPVLRGEVYTGAKVDAQLQDQMINAHRDEDFLRWDAPSNTLHLISLYDWFAEDFQRDGQTVITYVAQFCEPELSKTLLANRDRIKTRFLSWDWSLNGK